MKIISLKFKRYIQASDSMEQEELFSLMQLTIMDAKKFAGLWMMRIKTLKYHREFYNHFSYMGIYNTIKCVGMCSYTLLRSWLWSIRAHNHTKCQALPRMCVVSSELFAAVLVLSRQSSIPSLFFLYFTSFMHVCVVNQIKLNLHLCL